MRNAHTLCGGDFDAARAPVIATTKETAHGTVQEQGEAIQAADALREATQPGCPRYGNGTAPTHDSATNSTTVVNGDHQGITGGVHYGDMHFGR
ncbi:hypothetical protein ACFWJ5_42145 [Streptomyces qaidamensis]|uniref:hypothetical protein n=1 Tax=Streptomyces qaidamensis TaxID=1783515 RepID=UPI0036685F1F